MFYDTHAHLDYPDFKEEREGVIQRATDAGITKMITIGTDLESSRQAIELAERFPALFAAVGWHPSEAARAPHDIREDLRNLAQHPKVVAIGETGLDYYRLPSKKSGGSPANDEAYKAKQLDIFRQQLELAAELGLNCVVHQRESFEDTLAQVQEFAGRVRTVFHCFANPVRDMQRVLETGSFVSFTGIVTFKNAQTVRDTVAATPMGQFMLETDSPFLAPEPYRGKRCEPAYVREIAQAVMTVKQVSADELSRATCATAEAFFSKMRG